MHALGHCYNHNINCIVRTRENKKHGCNDRLWLTNIFTTSSTEPAHEGGRGEGRRLIANNSSAINLKKEDRHFMTVNILANPKTNFENPYLKNKWEPCTRINGKQGILYTWCLLWSYKTNHRFTELPETIQPDCSGPINQTYKWNCK